MLRLFNEMYKDVRDLPIHGDPDAQFTFGGWSWQRNAYNIWYIDWDEEANEFKFRAVRPWKEYPGALLWFDGSASAVDTPGLHSTV